MPTSHAGGVGALESALGAVRLGEPRSWRGLTVFPLYGEAERAPGYDSFGVARAAGTFRITEVSGSGVVAQLRAENGGLPERWVRGLLGRTREADDGEVFRLVGRAQRAFVGVAEQPENAQPSLPNM